MQLHWPMASTCRSSSVGGRCVIQNACRRTAIDRGGKIFPSKLHNYPLFFVPQEPPSMHVLPYTISSLYFSIFLLLFFFKLFFFQDVLKIFSLHDKSIFLFLDSEYYALLWGVTWIAMVLLSTLQCTCRFYNISAK